MNSSILITGADGNIGRKLITKLLDDTSCTIYALVIDAEEAKRAFRAEGISLCDRIQIICNQDFLTKDITLGSFDAVHLAFSRRNMPYESIANSIDFAQQIFARLKEKHVARIIYMSSQGVYGNCKEIRYETTPPAPTSSYTMAKYAVEKLFQVYFSDKVGSAACLRLDSVVQSQNLVQSLCKQAKDNGIIHLKGGTQRFSYIDIDDAVSAVLSLLGFEGSWHFIYNVGLNNGRITLMELAGVIATHSEQISGKAVRIELDEQDIESWAGMEATLFMNDTGWKPVYSVEDMVAHIYQTL